MVVISLIYDWRLESIIKKNIWRILSWLTWVRGGKACCWIRYFDLEQSWLAQASGISWLASISVEQQVLLIEWVEVEYERTNPVNILSSDLQKSGIEESWYFLIVHHPKLFKKILVNLCPFWNWRERCFERRLQLTMIFLALNFFLFFWMTGLMKRVSFLGPVLSKFMSISSIYFYLGMNKLTIIWVYLGSRISSSSSASSSSKSMRGVLPYFCSSVESSSLALGKISTTSKAGSMVSGIVVGLMASLLLMKLLSFTVFVLKL